MAPIGVSWAILVPWSAWHLIPSGTGGAIVLDGCKVLIHTGGLLASDSIISLASCGIFAWVVHVEGRRQLCTLKPALARSHLVDMVAAAMGIVWATCGPLVVGIPGDIAVAIGMVATRVVAVEGGVRAFKDRRCNFVACTSTVHIAPRLLAPVEVVVGPISSSSGNTFRLCAIAVPRGVWHLVPSCTGGAIHLNGSHGLIHAWILFAFSSNSSTVNDAVRWILLGIVVVDTRGQLTPLVLARTGPT